MQSKRYLVRLAALVLLVCPAACARPEQPEFIDLRDVEVRGARLDGHLLVRGDAVFRNPNRWGLDVRSLDAQVYVDDRPLARIRQDVVVQVPADSEFTLPLEFEIPIQEVFDDLKSFLSNLLAESRVTLQVAGKIHVQVAGVEFGVPFDHRETYEIDR